MDCSEVFFFICKHSDVLLSFDCYPLFMHLGQCSWLVQICVCWFSKSVFVEVPSLRGWLFSLCSLCACVLSLLNAVSSSQPVDQTCQSCDPNILCPNFPHTFSLFVIKRTVFKSSSISGVALSVSPYSSVCKCLSCQKTLSSFQGVSFTLRECPGSRIYCCDLSFCLLLINLCCLLVHICLLCVLLSLCSYRFCVLVNESLHFVVGVLNFIQCFFNWLL